MTKLKQRCSLTFLLTSSSNARSGVKAYDKESNRLDSSYDACTKWCRLRVPIKYWVAKHDASDSAAYRKNGCDKMISDVLSEAITEIDRYLRDYQDVYAGTVRESILEVRSIMHILRDELDTVEAGVDDYYIEG